MSRPLHFALPVLFLATALAFSSCVGTIYDHTYSYRRNYFKPPEEKKDLAAESILRGLDKKSDTQLLPGDTPPAAPGGLPAPAADIPGLPPAGAPPAGPDAGDPGAAPAPPAGGAAAGQLTWPSAPVLQLRSSLARARDFGEQLARLAWVPTGMDIVSGPFGFRLAWIVLVDFDFE